VTTEPVSNSGNEGQPLPGVDGDGGKAGSALDAVMDMELPVVVRFAATRMLLGDLLKLGRGSTIEFDRRPQFPVELLVNGKVVARGSAVTVRGNYGIRISEVLAASERSLPEMEQRKR